MIPSYILVFPSGDLDDVMRSGFFLPGWTNPNVARFLAKLVERGGSQIAHPALHATDQIGENIVYVTADFLQGFNAFRGDFLALSFLS